MISELQAILDECDRQSLPRSETTRAVREWIDTWYAEKPVIVGDFAKLPEYQQLVDDVWKQ